MVRSPLIVRAKEVIYLFNTSMREQTKVQKQQEAIAEIAPLGQQRYLEAGGDPRSCPGGRNGDDYLTDEERQEVLILMRKLAVISIKDGYVHCQGRAWKLPEHESKP